MSDITPAGRSSYNPAKFRPRPARPRGLDQFDPAASPWDQQHSGDALNRGARSEKEERIRPDGVLLPYQLYPEEHRLLTIHPQWETRFNSDGTREFYCVRQGEVKCSCGRPHTVYKQPWEEEPEGGLVSGWDENMLRAAGLDVSPRARVEPAVPEVDWWDSGD